MFMKPIRKGIGWVLACAGLVLGMTGVRADISTQTLLTFPSSNNASSGMTGPLCVGTDGYFYGTSGTLLIKVKPDGSGYAAFPVLPSSGNFGATLLAQSADGTLFGVVPGADTLFRVKPDGSGYTVLHQFNAAAGEGVAANGLVMGPDQLIYGTTQAGGANNAGTVFRIDQNGNNFSVLHSFSQTGGDGLTPWSPAVFGADGMLYGTTYRGGAGNYGTVYSLKPDGTGYKVLYSLNASGSEGEYCAGGVVLASDGKLYGTTYQAGGAEGTVFQLNTDGTGFRVIRAFSGADGAFFTTSLIEGSDGYLYGRDDHEGANGTGVAFRLKKDGTSYQVLYSFSSPPPNPLSYNHTPGLIEVAGGALYFVDPIGGASEGSLLLKVDLATTAVTALSDFGAALPQAAPNSLCLGTNGLLYGTTGGATLFSVRPDGTGLKNLYTFRGGASPASPVAQTAGRDGKIYGVTSAGSSRSGMVYKIEADGTNFSVIASCPALPVGIVQGADNLLYIVTSGGGSASRGSIFRVAPDGTGQAVVHDFVISASDGQTPAAGLIVARDGAMYGATTQGGAGSGGTVYRLGTDGTFTLLHSFGLVSGVADGPQSLLTEDSNGNICGVTISGDVFRLSKDGANYSVVGNVASLGSKANCLIQGPDGGLYGIVTVYGQNGSIQAPTGLLFRLATDGSGSRQTTPLPTPGVDGSLLKLGDGTMVGLTGQALATATFTPSTLFKVLPNGTTPPPGPTISFPPASTTAAAGSATTLGVTAAGTGLTYQWQVNGTAIPGATNATYTLTNLGAPQAGKYTVVVTDAAGLSVTSAAAALGVRVDAHPVNVSTRAQVGTGSSVLVAGFVIVGTTSETILVRGIGPTLGTQFHVDGALTQLQLTLFDPTGKAIATNAGWGGDATLGAVFTRVGAFALPANSADTAIVATLPPGPYTAQVSGLNGATGVGLIEVYDVPPANP